jgi:hypothetical protein
MNGHHAEGGLIPVAQPGGRKRFPVRVTPQRDGGVLATCDSPVCLARAATEDEALEKLRAEIRYRLELCPCTGVSEDYVQLDVERRSGDNDRAAPPRRSRATLR